MRGASSRWGLGFQRAVLEVIRAGKAVPRSSDPSVLSPMMLAARCGDVGALEALLTRPDVSIDEQDEHGFSPVMVAAREGHVDAFRLLVFAGADVRLSNRCGETAVALSQSNNKRDLFDQVMLELALAKGGAGGGFDALHCAARRGDVAAARGLLTGGGCDVDVNVPDGDGYTPLMLAAKGGHGALCELLISCGPRCDLRTHRGETALSLARTSAASASGGDAERVILDELARILVLGGARVRKHTKCGRGSPHGKLLRMAGAAGVLRWGKSSRRSVVCRAAEVGASPAFQRNRKGKGDAHEPGLFRVASPPSTLSRRPSAVAGSNLASPLSTLPRRRAARGSKEI